MIFFFLIIITDTKIGNLVVFEKKKDDKITGEQFT